LTKAILNLSGPSTSVTLNACKHKIVGDKARIRFNAELRQVQQHVILSNIILVAASTWSKLDRKPEVLLQLAVV
jgi:hypothetical protein